MSDTTQSQRSRAETMTSKQRVTAALNFEEADRVPRFWGGFWPEFIRSFREQKPGCRLDPYALYGDDVKLVASDETAWPTRAGVIREQGGERLYRTGWGAIERQRSKTSTPEVIESFLTERVDPDQLRFDDPALDSRYESAGKEAAHLKDDYFVFCKTGGPYLRAAYIRGIENFWMDIVEDPSWTKAFVDRVADHITAIGVEQIKRFGLQDSGIGIYDDIASSMGPVMGPKAYERIFLPALTRMITAYKDAGASRVLHHCDGNVASVLEMWVGAGVDCINPVEHRAGLDPVAIRRRFDGKLALIGTLDNCVILPRSDKAEIRRHVGSVLEAARGGGLVIGPHSIGPDISVETMDYVAGLLDELAWYPL